MIRSVVLWALAVSAALPAMAETVEVEMLNRGKHGSMVYEPAFVSIEPGDTVQFRVGARSHNAASIDTMKPAAGTGFIGQIDEEIAVTFVEPGWYGVKCSPHFGMGMGMVMIVRVGEVDLPEDFIDPSIPERAQKRFADILERNGLGSDLR